MGTTLVHCGICGLPLYHKLQNGRNHDGYFWCASKAKTYRKVPKGKKPSVDCGMGMIRVKKIEDDIELAVTLYLTDPEYINARLDEISNNGAVAEKKANINRMETAIENLEDERKRLVLALRKGHATEEDFAADMKDMKAKLERLQSKVGLLHDDIKHSMSKETKERIALDLAKGFADFRNGTRRRRLPRSTSA
jgi:hypothetical protein